MHAELIDKLGGSKQVSEMTGRSTRVERVNGKLVFAVRAASESSDMDSLNIMVSSTALPALPCMSHSSEMVLSST